MLHSLSAPDIHLLKVFVTVVNCGGFSAAQVTLNVTQSTISTQMANLETRLGTRLCTRGPAGFALTDDGRVVYNAAKDLFRSFEDFTTTVNSQSGAVSGELRIAFDDALVGNSDFLLDRSITRFHQHNPGVEFDLCTVDPLSVEQGLLDGRFHIGISSFPSHVPGMVYRRLFTELQTLYCGRRHPLFDIDDETLTIAKVQGHPYARRTYTRGAIRSGIFKPERSRACAGTMEALLLLVRTGEFTAHLPRHWAETWVQRREIRPLLPDQLSFDTQFEVVIRTGSELSNLVAAFLDYLYADYA